MEIVKNKSKLRNFRGTIVYIDNHQTSEEGELLKLLEIKAKDERQADWRVKIGYQRTEMDGYGFGIKNSKV